MLKKFSDSEGNFFSNKFVDLPNVFCLLFSIPAMIAAFVFIYSLMDKLFLIPVSLLLFIFIFQIRNQVYLARTFKKVSFFLQSRSLLLKKIFSYGNRVHLLSMEAFFIRKINSLQQNGNNITINILNRLSASRVIYYYSGFIIAIPSIICFTIFHHNSSLASIAALLVFFILVAHLYSNILSFFSRRQELENNFKVFNSNVSLIKNESHDLKIEKVDEVDENCDFPIAQPSTAAIQEKIWFHKASFMSSNVINLYNISFEQKPGTIVAVVGQPASGKSSFLSACTGELRLISGEKKLPNQFEVLPQDVSLFDGTLRENIILGREFEGRRYIEVVRSCCLEDELNALEDGDETYLDAQENDFKESFLRKIGIARTMYAKSDFYYFDEPFYGLSTNEASHIFNEGILRQLQGINRILITQKLELASLCDHILVMKDGMVVEQGSHKSLVEKAGIYARLHYAGADSRQFGLSLHQTRMKFKGESKSNIEKMNFYDFSFYDKTNEIKYVRQILTSTKFFLESYFKNKDPYVSFAFVLFSQVFICLAFYSLFSQYASEKFSRNTQIILFGSFSVLSMALFYFFHVKNAMTNILFGSSLEKKVYDVLIKEYQDDHSYTASYLDKFSKVKNDLFTSITSLMVRVSFIVAGCFMLSIANISALFLIIALGIFTSVFFLIKKASYIRAYFNLQSEKNKLGRSTHHFLNSLISPNSFSYRVFLHNKLEEKINLVQEKARVKDKIIISFSQFVSISLCVVTAVSLSYFVTRSNTIFPGTVILAFLAAVFFFQAFISIEEDLQRFIKCIPYFESLMRASIRYKESESQHYSTSEYWPQKGSLRVMSLTIKNTKDYPYPIINMDLFIPHASRFGLIAEKGHHKTSSFFASLLLFVPFESGTIILDDEDLLKLNPLDLRDRYGYISMDSLFPFLTLRENLDPSEQFDDSEIWSVLNRVGVAQSVAVLRNGLNTKIEEFPRQMVWSGEMVLFSFARALLYGNKILLVDNLIVPEDAELRIIDLIARDFTDTTVIISAHAKSSLLTICADIARFEDGVLRRATLDKVTYHTSYQLDGNDFGKNV
jgi:ABC-type multidrug transport system fused ATPase/permease subunit